MSSSVSIYFTCARGGLHLVQCLLGLPLLPPGRGGCNNLTLAEHHPPLAAPCPGPGSTQGMVPHARTAMQRMPQTPGAGSGKRGVNPA